MMTVTKNVQILRIVKPMMPERKNHLTPANRVKSYLLIALVFVLAVVLAAAYQMPIQNIMKDYQYNVLVILIVMELFTNLIADTGIMQFLATRLAVASHGSKRLIIAFFGTMMFIVSAFLNNITAVMVILPVIFVLLKAIEIDREYICTFFAVILAISNTGGASSPIGDFPAIIIMTSGITTFVDYLYRAMPLFLITSTALMAFWLLRMRIGQKDAQDGLAVGLLLARHKHIHVDRKTLLPLCFILLTMLLAWSFIPQSVLPPEVVAVLGYVAGVVICAARGKPIKMDIDFKAVLTIAAFLFLACVIGATGILERIVVNLQVHVADPRVLLILLMLITSVLSGLFSAGPAAAAMMPVMVSLCNTTLAAYTHWVAIAYAAAICAGSSLFLWSATAGFILSAKIEDAKLGYSWGIGSYLKYGVVNYLIQMAIVVIAILLAIH